MLRDATLIGSIVVAFATLAGVLYTSRTTARGQNAGHAIDGLARLGTLLEARVASLEGSLAKALRERDESIERTARVVRLFSGYSDALLAYIARWSPVEVPPPPQPPEELRRLLYDDHEHHQEA